MKKYFLGAAALLALTACSNDETVDLNQDGNVISFAVTANNPSRAAANEVFNPNALPQSFTVYAAYDGKTYFQNETFTKQGATSNYNSAKTHYWPAVDGEKKVTFVAFRNAGDDLSTNFIWKPNAASTLSYTVPATAAEQTDFIYAVTNSQRPIGGQVGLNFRHALAQVVFKAKVTNPNLYVEIKGVSVCKAYNKGTFTFPFDKVTDPNHKDDQEGAFNFDATTQGSWSVQDDSQTNYALTFDKVGIANGHTENLTAHDAVRVTDANTLLLLPQKTTPWTVGTHGSKPEDQAGSYFLVQCRIRNVANGTSVDEDKDVYLWGSSSEYKEVAVPATFDWKQGKKYIITFEFGNGNGGYDPDNSDPVLVPISFTVTVDDFAKGDDQTVEMK